MYCPECGAEYREGIYECADCGSPLTQEPPAPPSDEDLVSVFRSADAGLLPVIKSLLAAEGIPFTVQGDETSGLFPFGSAGGGADGRRLGAVVRVPASRAAEAEALLEAIVAESANGEGGEEEAEEGDSDD